MVEREPVTIRLHGPLAERYGADHAFRINSPREALHALDANFPGFRRDFLAHDRYALVIDGDLFADDAAGDVGGLPVSRQIDICPVIEGRFVGLIAPLFVSAFGIGMTAATIISGVLVAGLLIGVSLLLSPKAKKKTAADTPKDESYMFSGPENLIEQGVPVPLLYGKPFCGSAVISTGLQVDEIPVSTPASFPYDWPWRFQSMGLRASADDPPPPPLPAVLTAAPEPAPLPPPVMTSRIWRGGNA